jgi:HPt (histidine-containing phosphotransfer) domain-containing protein
VFVGDPVDLVRLEEFADGTPDGVPRLIRLFLEDATESMEELTAAREAGDAAALRRLAHRFGGSSAACGAARLAAALFELESLPLDAAPGAAPLLREIDAAWSDTMGFLTRYLETQAQS